MKFYRAIVALSFTALNCAMEKPSEAAQIRDMIRRIPEISPDITNGVKKEDQGNYTEAALQYEKALETTNILTHSYATMLLCDVKRKNTQQPPAALNKTVSVID